MANGRTGAVLAGVLAAAGLCGCTSAALRRTAEERFVAGQLLLERGRLGEAVRELSRAIEADPELSVAHAALGDIHRRRGDHARARTCYETACRTDPYAFRPHYNLGVTYQVLAAAARAVEKANRYLRRAVEVYLRAATLEPDDFDTHLNLGACYFQLGKYELAEHYCRAAIEIAPRRPEAYANLGVIYDSQGRLEDAVKAYKDSLERDTHQPGLLLNLGATYLRQKRLKQAKRIFALATTEAPGQPGPWEQMGACHYHLGEYPEAVQAFRKALSLDHASAMAHRGLGVVYMTQYVRNDERTELRDKALASWRASLQCRPDQPDLVRLLRKYGA
jgi:Flp pilus assembly protein TadD